jgi:hypothetical protein
MNTQHQLSGALVEKIWKLWLLEMIRDLNGSIASGTNDLLSSGGSEGCTEVINSVF